MIGVLPGSSTQDHVLLTGEQANKALFSTYLKTNEPRDILVDQFLSMLRFESKGKMDDLGLEIDSNTTISTSQRISD